MAHVSARNAQANEAKSWETAKSIAEGVKPLPIAFTSSIRLLVNDHAKNQGQIRPVTKFQIARIFRSASFKAMLYYATKDLFPQEITDQKYISSGTLINLYTAGDLASLIGMYVFFKKARRINSEQEWLQLRKDLVTRIQAGAAVGSSIPKIGIGTGILVNAMPIHVLCMLAKYDQKTVTEYRRHLSQNDYQFDYAHERKIWECDIGQISTFVLSLLGFGVDISEALQFGLDKKKKFHQLKNDLHVDFHMARLWTTAFIQRKEQPMDTVPGEYFPFQGDRDRAVLALDLVEDDSYVHWFERTGDDISRDLTPELFKAKEEDQNASGDGLEVPDDLKEVFSLDEITEMEEEDFDDLIDQIDKEQEGEVAIGDEKMGLDDLDDLDSV